MSNAPAARPIRSYVLRQGRFTEAQSLALKRLWPAYGLDWQQGLLSPAELFGRTAPLCMEIGFGNGEALVEMASQHPERDFLGVEVHGPGVGHLLLRVEALQLHNVRVFRGDAVAFLKEALATASVERLYLFFPDPWPKKRHHKRRIVQPAFLTLVAEKLKPGGRLHMATDWQEYAQHMLATANQAAALLRNIAGTDHFSKRPPERPHTHFEARGERLGHSIWDLILERNP